MPYIEDQLFVFLGLSAALGASLGSFAGLVISRIPRGESIIAPRSYCFFCHRKIKIWHNIPLLSWFLLRGRCYFCKAYIGIRPLALEFIFALAVMALFVKFGFSIAFAERLLFFFILVCLAYIDIDTFYLPYSLLAGLFFIALAFTLIYHWSPTSYVIPELPFSLMGQFMLSTSTVYRMGDRLIGGIVGFAFFSCANIITTALLRITKKLGPKQWAMGWGDPVLMTSIGMVVGYVHLIAVVLISSVMGILFSVVSTKLWPCNNSNDLDVAPGAIPFGPFIAIAAIFVYCT